MALELRPNCEYCDIDLPPASLEARICTFECTFRADCVETKLHNVLPQLRRRLRPAPDPARDRVASGPLGGKSATLHPAPLAQLRFG
ncbi:MAG: DUF1272 domain-containing protein [Sphingomonas sp.]